ncbi:MAG: GNAT family N-acetyltransferase [Micavibrio sp.]|nr:GNAT family N-acetyltransferase [Micavibrio sp.]
MTKTSDENARNEKGEPFFKTQRLSYHLLTHKHDEDLHKTLNAKESCEALSLFFWPLDQKQITNFCDIALSVHQKDNGLVLLAYLDDQPAGHLGLWNEPESVQIGYWVTPGFHGQGFASEMVQGGLEIARLHFKATKAWATTANDNISSQKVLQKNGFIKTESKLVPCEDGTLRPSKVFTRSLVDV